LITVGAGWLITRYRTWLSVVVLVASIELLVLLCSLTAPALHSECLHKTTNATPIEEEYKTLPATAASSIGPRHQNKTASKQLLTVSVSTAVKARDLAGRG